MILPTGAKTNPAHFRTVGLMMFSCLGRLLSTFFDFDRLLHKVTSRTFCDLVWNMVINFRRVLDNHLGARADELRLSLVRCD